MDQKDILNDIGKQKVTIDSNLLQITLLKYLITINIKQEVILTKQLEIKELLGGKNGQELDDAVSSSLESLLDQVDKDFDIIYAKTLNTLIS